MPEIGEKSVYFLNIVLSVIIKVEIYRGYYVGGVLLVGNGVS